MCDDGEAARGEAAREKHAVTNLMLIPCSFSPCGLYVV